jgi:hypothetical protein
MNQFKIYSRRGQEIVMVLYALRELGGIRTKQEVLRYIRANHFYAIQPEDTASYEGKTEWKADTLLCWGRKDAVMDNLGWMFHHDEKDSWEIARPGLTALDDIFARFQSKRWEVHRCFMWRPEFKRIVDQSYIPSERDWPRLRTPRERRQKVLDEL